MVLILLSTYNGSSYLNEFLLSLQLQSETNWSLLLRDDMSSDDSINIVKNFFKTSPEKLSILKSTGNVGVKESFHLLIKEATHLNNYDYIMFADQDDIWKEDKIAITLKKMKTLEKNNNQAVLLHTDLDVTDENLTIIDNSLWHYEGNTPQKNSLNYLLYQNTVTGCTMMANRALINLAYPINKDAIMHDWWFAMVASVFGEIGIVEEKTIYYRQHNKNTIGAKEHNRFALFKKIFFLITLQNDDYLIHLEEHRVQAKAFLKQYHATLSQKEIELLNCFINLPNMNFFQKRINIIRFKCFRQSFIQTISLLLRV